MFQFKPLVLYDDSVGMDVDSITPIIISLLLDWRILVVFAVVLLYLNFIFYITRYRKKQKRFPAKAKKRRAKPVKPVSSDEGDVDSGEVSA